MLRLYRLLLRLQPPAVRRRYGAEMLDLVRRRAEEDGSAAFWLRELRDLLATAAAARRVAAGWLLVAAAVLHAGYAAAVYPEAAMGIGAIVLTAAALLGGTALLVEQRSASN
jgi:hypothetical protein